MEEPKQFTQRMALFIADSAEVLARLNAINQKLHRKVTKILNTAPETLDSEYSSTNPEFLEQTVEHNWFSQTDCRPFHNSSEEESLTD